MNRLYNPSGGYQDLIASHLRSQIVALHHVLEMIERTTSYQDDYIISSIRTVENDLRRIRNIIESN